MIFFLYILIAVVHGALYVFHEKHEGSVFSKWKPFFNPGKGVQVLGKRWHFGHVLQLSIAVLLVLMASAARSSFFWRNNPFIHNLLVGVVVYVTAYSLAINFLSGQKTTSTE